ncbi:hypothetical protein CR513_08553, partial [Mucuna pruriens]
MVALSSCKTEYVVASMSACQLVWETKVNESRAINFLVNNKSTTNLSKHLILYGRSKHQRNDELIYYNIDVHVAKILTKPSKQV